MTDYCVGYATVKYGEYGNEFEYSIGVMVTDVVEYLLKQPGLEPLTTKEHATPVLIDLFAIFDIDVNELMDNVDFNEFIKNKYENEAYESQGE